MRRLSWIALVLLLAVPVFAAPAGTVVVTTREVGNLHERFVKYSIDWTSDASGDVAGNTFTPRAGRITQVRFVPDGGGTAPDADYDVTLVDTDGFDWLETEGADLSATATVVHLFTAPKFYDATQALDLDVANAGNANGGVVHLWIQVQ